MKKLRAMFIAAFCMTVMLVGCGESPTAPSADVPLMSAPAVQAWPGTNTLKGDTIKSEPVDPDRAVTSGYAIAM